MALSGSYSLVRSENLLEHFIGNGIPEDEAKDFVERGKKLEISIDGDNVTIKLFGDADPRQNLILNQEVEEQLGDFMVKSNTVLNGNVLTVDSTVGSTNNKREYTLVGEELTVVLFSSKPDVPNGKRIYQKD